MQNIIKRSQQGVQFIEAAIGLPVLLLAVFAFIEFARFLSLKSLVNGVAEQAASLASTQSGLEEEDVVVAGHNLFQEARIEVENEIKNSLQGKGLGEDPASGSYYSSIALDIPGGDQLKGTTRRQALESQPLKVSIKFKHKSLLVPYFNSKEFEVTAAAYKELSRKVSSPVALDCWGKPVLLLSDVNPSCPCVGSPDDPRLVANPADATHCMCTDNIPHINFAAAAYGNGPMNMNSEGRIGMTLGPDGKCQCSSPYGGRYEYNEVSQQCECAYPTREDLQNKFSGCYAADGTRVGWFHPKECQCKYCGPNTVAAEDPNNYLNAICACRPDFTCPDGQQVKANFWGIGCYCASTGPCDYPLVADPSGECTCNSKCNALLYQDPTTCNCYCRTKTQDITQLVPTIDPSVCSQNGHCIWSAATQSWECDFGQG